MAWQRNLVIVLAHGLRSDVVGQTGAWPLVTPHLDRLMRRGMRLVASSACPADWGGLVSLLTGLHARQHGYMEAAEQPPTVEGWPAWLAAAGYHVAGVGCVAPILPWLTESVVVDFPHTLEPHGCAYLQAMHATGKLPAILDQRRQRLRYGPFEPDRLILEPDEDIDGFIIAQARRMFTRLPEQHPWALIVMFSGPANELPPPRLYTDLVEPRVLEAGFMPMHFPAVGGLAELDYPAAWLQRLEPQKVGRIRSDYLGRSCLLDFGIGRLAAAMHSRTDKDRTWLTLAGDRGQLLGEHGLVGHRSFLCPALETPVVIVPPTPLRQTHYETALVNTVDVAATIAALGGCDLPAHCAGLPLTPILSAQPWYPARTGASLSEFSGRLLLQTERYKVIFDTTTHHAIGLYDLFGDQDERENLLATPRGKDQIDALRLRLGAALLPLRAGPSTPAIHRR